MQTAFKTPSRTTAIARALAPLLLAGLLLQGQAPPSDAASESDSKARETFAGSVDVKLVELYVSVTGEAGKPVPGLDADEFAVIEDGVEQRLASVVDASDLPMTLGLAVDTSASMFVKLPFVAEAAQGLLDSLESGRDRAFLVSFGPEPELEQGATDGLWKVGSALARLEPDGGTPLYRGIVLSLEELSRAPGGKKALVVLLDGADDDGPDAFKRCLEAAEKGQVPIYLVVMNNEAARTGGKDFRTRSFTSQLDRIAEATGGRVYYTKTDAALAPIYSEIQAALKSYYLVAYYPEHGDAAGRWRDVKVRVARQGLSVRALPGYRR